MRIFKRAGLPALATLVLFYTGMADAGKPHDWAQVEFEGDIETVLPDGSTRTLKPSCSGAPIFTPEGVVTAAPTEYSFFIQKGNPNKVLIALDGGGACWDSFTCSSTLSPENSTYSPTVDETTESLAQGGGVFDSKNPANPYKNYTKIFVPYCSADIHWGSKDTTYDIPNLGAWPIHHRGTDNFLAVLDWVQKNGRQQYGIDFKRARDITVTGASAGAYGANLAFAYVAEMAGKKARLNLVSDSGIGVIDTPEHPQLPFYTTAIYNSADQGSESWGVAPNLPAWVPNIEMLLPQGEAQPNSLLPYLFTLLSDYKPKAKLASTTSNLDLVQVFFYGLQKGIVPPDNATLGEWYFSMKQMTDAAASNPNYRYFIDAGTFHTFIFSSDQFYRVGANGISLADWITAMIKPGNRAWDNLDAGSPF